MGAFKRARCEFVRKQAMALERAGQPQSAGLLGREAEAAVVGRVTHQDNGAMAEPTRLGDRAAHQSAADSAVTTVGGDGEGAEQECLYLVRPDGFIGWRSQPVDLEALLAHLARWFT